MGIKVTCEVQILEIGGEKTTGAPVLVVESTRIKRFVVIETLNGQRYTVNGEELREAITNAMNMRQY